MRSPERACARARVHPHSRAYSGMPDGSICSIGTENFQSFSWRT